MGWDFDFLRRLQHIGIIVINMKHAIARHRRVGPTTDCLTPWRFRTVSRLLGGQRFNWQAGAQAPAPTWHNACSTSELGASFALFSEPGIPSRRHF